MNSESRPPKSKEVAAAVDDILNGRSVDSASEWLQREYIRLMRRECHARGRGAKKKRTESDLKSEVNAEHAAPPPAAASPANDVSQ